MLYIAFFSAVLLAVVAAAFSVIGLAQIFHGAFVSVVIMGASLELAKLSTAMLVHRYWDTLTLTLKSYLIIATAVLMLLTSAGIFGYLSKASQTLATGITQSTTQISFIVEELEQLEKQKERQQSILDRLDGMIDKYTSQENFRDVRRGAILYQNQKEVRDQALNEISEINTRVRELNQQKVELQKSVTEVEVEVGPAVYIAQLLYEDKGIDSIENAIRIAILLIIFAFDPLAICLLLACQAVWINRNKSPTPILLPVTPTKQEVKPTPKTKYRKIQNKNSM